MSNAMLIMDQYKRYERALNNGQKINPVSEANELSRIANAFGRHPRCIAIVNRYDHEGTQAYQQAHFELISVNGERPKEIWQHMNRLKQDIGREPPHHLIVITDDPAFQYLLDPAVESGKTNLVVWYLNEMDSTFSRHDYNARPFSELIQEPKVPKVSIRLDYENLHIGLVQRGWKPNCKQLIEAIKKATEEFGQVVNIVAYADWGLLSRKSNLDFQRELASIGVETRYQINERGKNSADMQIADDIRTLVERPSTAPDAIDLVVLGTNDRDFRPTLETAKARGQRIMLLAIKDGLSNQLKGVADEIRFLDDYLRIEPPIETVPDHRPKAKDKYAELMIRVATWLRDQRWKFAAVDELTPVVTECGGMDALNHATEAGLFCRGRTRRPDGLKETLMPDLRHPLAEVAYRLVRWAPAQVKYGLETYGHSYVDTLFMFRGMEFDKDLKRLGVGQNRQEAEQWLDLLAQLGVLNKEEREHATVAGKMVTTWWVPGQHHEPTGEIPMTEANLESRQIRELVKDALNDDELTELCFDHFRPVYERFGDGMPKGRKVQMLVEYAERRNVTPQLIERLQQWNPTRVAQFAPLATAA